MDKQLNLEAVQSRMERTGLSAAALARSVGVSREAVSRWLSGQSFPRPDKLLKLALTLRLRVGDFVISRAGEATPVIAFRKRGAVKITEKHILHAQEIGRLLRRVVPFLPFDRFVRPATLKQPTIEYRYLQELAARIRGSIGVVDGDVIDFSHLIRQFADLQTVLIPVLWGVKERHENALHIFLPDSMTTWVYLNLDVEVHDFKFWMAHELGHVLAPDLRGDEAEDFANSFAGALLFPELLARNAYKGVSAEKNKGGRINAIKLIAESNTISPITVYREINHFASHHGYPEIDLEPAIYGAAKNLSKQYLTVSASLFGSDNPEAVAYVKKVSEVFGTPFFESLRAYLLAENKGAGFVQTVLDVPFLDAREIHAALT